VEPADIERIKNTHRPRPRWLACWLLTGCTCGAPRWPCWALLAARDAESRTNQLSIEAWQRMVINRPHGRYPL